MPIDPIAKQQAIEYRRQLLRIADKIARDYELGEYAPEFSVETVPGTEGDLSEKWKGVPLGAVDLRDSQAVAALRSHHIDTPQKK